MPRPSRRSARPRSSSARRSPPAPIWSARKRRAISPSCRTACRRRRSRQIRAAIEQGLGKPIEQIFAEIDPEPVGAASIAQVHRAVTTDGRQVAVKVLRPNIEEDFAGRSRPMNGRRRRSRRWAARRRGCGPALVIADLPAMDQPRARPAPEAASASELRENLVAESGFFVPEIDWSRTVAAGDDARMDRRHQADRPRRAGRRRPRSARRSPRSWSAPSCARRWSTASSTPIFTRAISSPFPTAGWRRSISGSWAGSTGRRGSGWPRSSTA